MTKAQLEAVAASFEASAKRMDDVRKGYHGMNTDVMVATIALITAFACAANAAANASVSP